MMKKKNYYFSKICVMALAVFAFACGDDGDDTPPPQPVADFTMEMDEEDPLTVHFTNASENGDEFEWDFGDGSTSTEESPSHTFESTGSHDVTLTVTSGDLTDAITKTVTIESPGGVPVGANVIDGGDMENPDAWNVKSGTEDGSVINYEFTEDGTLYFSGDAEPEMLHELHVWQEIELEADVEYLFYAEVSGGGFNNAYLEIDIGTILPVENESYADPNVDAVLGIDETNSKVVGINFWTGCGADPFEGDIVEVGCDGPAQEPDPNDPEDESTNGRIVVSYTGTYYFLIKAGTWSGTMGDGVNIDNILLAPIIDEE